MYSLCALLGEAATLKGGLGPFEGGGAVNRALRALGVETRPGQVEFDAAGLSRHHSLEEWLSEA